MGVLDDLLHELPDAQVKNILIGLFWTVVVVDTPQGIRGGMAATLRNPLGEHERKPSVQAAGRLSKVSSRDLAGLIHSESLTEASLGMATINALLPILEGSYVELNAEDYIAQNGAGRNVAMIGHFPFVQKLKPILRNLWVLELEPKGDDLPAEEAPNILPQADIVAITGTTLINRTFDGLMALCQPHSTVILLGPTTPMSPILFDYGVSILSGAIVDRPRLLLRGVSQGATLRQLRQEGGVRLVTMKKD